MRPKTLILMVVAIACGLVASFMTQRAISNRQPQEMAPEEKVAVLVARYNLAQGISTKDPEKHFTVKLFTKGEEPKKAIRALYEPSQALDEVAVKLYEQVKDRRLNKPLVAEQFVSAEDLLEQQNAGLAAVMARGMRALGVKVDTSAVAGGFVLPNSRVDVVWVQRRGENDSTARVLLQNVLVLAVGTVSQRPEDKQALLENTVTLAVTPEQAEKLSLASEMGTLRLILRAFGDEEIAKTTGVDPKSLAKANSDPGSDTPVEVEEPAVAPKANAVWVNRIPDLPKPAGSATPAVDAGGKTDVAVAAVDPTRVHVLTIHNGESIKRVKFALNDQREVDETTREEIQRRTELPVIQPGAAVAPPAGAVPSAAPQPSAPQASASQPAAPMVGVALPGGQWGGLVPPPPGTSGPVPSR